MNHKQNLLFTGFFKRAKAFLSAGCLLCLSLGLFCFASYAQEGDEFAAIRRFMSARMYGEAYLELLKQELNSGKTGKKLDACKKSLLYKTRERLEKQAKVSPDDPNIFLVLADISFNENKLNEAENHITRSLQNKKAPLADYIYAKILFKKGDMQNAFEHIMSALDAMPDCAVLFEDYRFLYYCKNYGAATAKKLSKNTGFLTRSKQLCAEAATETKPESPFENDPTAQPEAKPKTEETETTESALSLSDDENELESLPNDEDSFENDLKKLSETIGKDVAHPSDAEGFNLQQNDEAEADEAFNELNEDNEFNEDNQKKLSAALNEDPLEALIPEETQEADPEKENIKEAEKLIKAAEVKFAEKNYEQAKTNVELARKLYPELPSLAVIDDKLQKKFELFEKYKNAKDMFDLEKFDEALPVFLKVEQEEPGRYPSNNFYIGVCYASKKEPDDSAAMRYFAKVLKNPNITDELRRDVEWTQLEIYFNLRRYQDANVLLQKFLKSKNISYAKNQTSFTQIRYRVWYEVNKTLLWVCFGFLAFLCFFVLFIGMLPGLSTLFSTPIEAAQKAYAKGKYQKAADILEKALKKPQPIQIKREMLEWLIKANFELKNYVKSQRYCKELLEDFHDSTLAWGYLAKASVATNDTSDEAVSMYEAIYKDDPGKTEYLPILAEHYAKTKNYSLEAMQVLFTFYQSGQKNEAALLALADGYVQNKSMGTEVIAVLKDAVKVKDKTEYRELLARSCARENDYAEAAKECLYVLNENIDNIGIHVVYTSSMKKLGKLEEAIEQYRAFIERYPQKEQLSEIYSGLTKDLQGAEAQNGGLSFESEQQSFSMPDLPSLSPEGQGAEETPPEGVGGNMASKGVPMPDFLKEQTAKEGPANEAVLPDLPDINADNYNEAPANASVGAEGSTAPIAPELGLPNEPDKLDKLTASLPELPDISPFAETDDFLNDITTDLPSELNGAAEFELPAEPANDVLSQTGADAAFNAQLELAKEHLNAKRYDDVIAVLANRFASERSEKVGILLADAWLGRQNVQTAAEVLETLDFDPEMMSEDLKNIFYKTGVALEAEGKIAEALKMYDTICNADINYKDAFDRSDRLYSQKNS